MELPLIINLSESRSVVSDSLWPHGLYSPWNSLGQNAGVGRLSLLQGIFPTQESNWNLLHCRQILSQLSYKGSPSKWKCESLNCAWLFVMPWTAACQAPLPMDFSRQEYWSGLPFPSQESILNSEQIDLRSHIWWV